MQLRFSYTESKSLGTTTIRVEDNLKSEAYQTIENLNSAKVANRQTYIEVQSRSIDLNISPDFYRSV